MTQSVTVTLESPSRKLANSLLIPLQNGSRNDLLYPSHSNGKEHQYSSTSLSKNDLASAAVSSMVSVQSKSSLVFIGLLLVWYSLSVGHNILNKRLLEPDFFPFPFTLTLLQLGAITVYSYMYIRYANRGRQTGLLEPDANRHVVVALREVLSKKRNRSLIVFLSCGKFMSLVFSHLSLYQIPLAFAHTGNHCIICSISGTQRLSFSERRSSTFCRFLFASFSENKTHLASVCIFNPNCNRYFDGIVKLKS